MAPTSRQGFESWYGALERRHLHELEFAEVRRGLQALSSFYVSKRSALTGGGALRGKGKRAAFALFYAPLHFLAVGHVVRRLRAQEPVPREILDLGCGTGAAAAAWALSCAGVPQIHGIDLHPWAVAETRWNWRALGLRGRVEKGRLEQARLPDRSSAVLLAYTVNELAPDAREPLLESLLRNPDRGPRILIVEPISKRTTPWWGDWSRRFLECGGRADEWRFEAELPEKLRLLDHAAGLDHSQLTARTLYLAPNRTRSS